MTNKPTWEERITMANPPYEIKIDGKITDDTRLKQFILDLLAERDEQWAKWKVLAEAMDNAPVGHRVTIKHLLGEDEWTLTRRNKTN